MEEYKSNSNKLKRQEAAPVEKKVEKVVTGETAIKKKDGLQKFADIFIAEDVSNVKTYILREVLIPAMKKTVSDIVTNGLDMFLYGGNEPSRRSGNSASKVSYRSYYGQDERKEKPYRAPGKDFEYDSILFKTRGDAEAVLDAMNDIISQYEFVSVEDLYDLADYSNNNYNASKYGWWDIEGCKAVRVREGYILKLPKPVPYK